MNESAPTTIQIGFRSPDAFVLATAVAGYYRSTQQLPDPVFSAIMQLSQEIAERVGAPKDHGSRLHFSSRGDLLVQLSDWHKKLVGGSLTDIFGTAGSPK